MSTFVTGFEPFAFPDSELLILGSFPSVKSRAQGFYYGNPQNRFWKTVCAFFGELPPADIDGKKDFLFRRKIALWDVVTACEITGSSDASIRNEKVADVAALVANSRIRAVYCNGKTAYSLLMREPPANVPILCLPSTSPANPRFLAAAWEEALRKIFQGQT